MVGVTLIQRANTLAEGKIVIKGTKQKHDNKSILVFTEEIVYDTEC